MKKLILFFSLAFVIFSACSADVTKEAELKSLTGRIYQSGGELMPILILELENGETIRLEGTRETINEISKYQMGILKVYFTVLKNDALGKSIEIIKFEKEK